jgi:hypothetical protein
VLGSFPRSAPTPQYVMGVAVLLDVKGMAPGEKVFHKDVWVWFENEEAALQRRDDTGLDYGLPWHTLKLERMRPFDTEGFYVDEVEWVDTVDDIQPSDDRMHMVDNGLSEPPIFVGISPTSGPLAFE